LHSPFFESTMPLSAAVPGRTGPTCFASRTMEEKCMHVRAILDEKGRNVLTIRPDATLQDAVRALHENRIGALVVLGVNEQIRGILSERDIINAVARHGAAALGKTVSTVMTSNVHRCTED